MPSLLELKIDKQFMQAHTMSFMLPADDDKVQYLVEDQEMTFEDEVYIVDKIETYRDDNEIFVKVDTSALWYRLGERSYSGLFQLTNKTPQQGLEAIVAAMQEAELDWEIQQQPLNDGEYSMDATDASFLDILLQWCKVTSHELDFNTAGRWILMNPQIGGGQVISFRYRRNLTSIHRVVSPPQVTRIYPYGRDDLDITAITGGDEFLEDYSYYTAAGLTLPEARTRYRKDEVYKDDTFIDDQSLYAAASNRLELLAQPTVSYTAKVADLSHITGYDESRFHLGDSVIVDDEPLGITVTARIVRYVRYPYEPDRNEVELSFIPVLLPDPKVSSSRSDRGSNWDLFVSRNKLTPIYASTGHIITNRMQLEVGENSQWVVGLSLKGTVVDADCTLYVEFKDDATGETYAPFETTGYALTLGQVWTQNFSFGDLELTAGTHRLTVRMYTTSGTGRLYIPAMGASLWVLAKGMTRTTPTFDNSVVYSYTGAIQSFQVPDGVYQIQVAALGAAGGNAASDGALIYGFGGSVTATFDVEPGQRFDVFVSNKTVSVLAGYPSGVQVGGTYMGGAGTGDAVSGANGFGGGGATSLVPEGMNFTNAWIVAPGGGGGGQSFSSNRQYGGSGGFYVGADAPPLGIIWPPTGGNTGGICPGPGATQLKGGTPFADLYGATAVYTISCDGVFGQGGSGADATNAFNFPPGGGGGGWYGGGGGGTTNSSGSGTSGGGGGGSGWLAGTGYDMEIADASNNANGQMTISWPDPVLVE